MAIADAGEAVFVPAVGARPRVVVREVVPGRAVRAVVLAHRAPGALAQIRPPALPVLWRSRVSRRGGCLLRPSSLHHLHGVPVGVAHQQAFGEHRASAARPTTPGETSMTRWLRNRSSAGLRRRSTSVVSQCARSLAWMPAAGRPSRGARYSRNSMPGPVAARSPVMRSRAPNTLFRRSCSGP